MGAVAPEVKLNLFLFGVGHHKAAWRAPDSAVERLGDVDYYIDLARTAERGKLDAVFFADGHSLGIGAVEDGPTWFLEPLTLLSAMSQHTERIGLVSTVSSTFWTPFHAARLLAGLDHITGGRIGWNVVTSMFDAEAQNHSYPSMPAHAERYARAEEFIDAVIRLWDSWPQESLLHERDGRYADGGMIAPIDHQGEHFQVAGPLNVPRPPQGRPVLFQAGASEQGRDLAARHAEAIYAVAYDAEAALDYSTDVRRRLATVGREPRGTAIMPGLVTYVGSTIAEARAKQAALDELLPTEASLRQLSVFIGQDASGWELDAPVPDLPPLEEFTGPKGRYATILRIIATEQPTVRQLLGRLAAGGGHCTMVGTPESVADEIERWVDSGAADGFNLMPPTLPGGIEDFVEHVVPELQRRGRFRSEYTGTTLRDHLGLQIPERRGSEVQESALSPAGG
ncbi:LLM class flavin-dependent oxidoreductase [Nesterenkonia xinjiangensis]|uniref:FMN-dependent oxidoreductase (Nitrilotriacetate monooxygenase family) n=1 Tax=Nesterenkonia xinjiangensis TaxID=225327 RepID=A0A7Z0KA55_9MICC|nr:LLM class flavin-dependent oxidoreductase [Nesterenkonia xinjiangensis]NYJ78468.1 FMN-dependent oxidoreductase (nitrilotriacetate monooxygenase family) [Nesterenkonia xinjiangensis]